MFLYYINCNTGFRVQFKLFNTLTNQFTLFNKYIDILKNCVLINSDKLGCMFEHLVHNYTCVRVRERAHTHTCAHIFKSAHIYRNIRTRALAPSYTHAYITFTFRHTRAHMQSHIHTRTRTHTLFFILMRM